MTYLTLLAVALAGLSVPTASAHAAPATCQGQAATSVGTPGGSAIGTDGPDVIVSNGATLTNGLAGDDLICITGDTGKKRPVKVYAGDGDDEVHVTGGDRTLVELGAGADVFVGCPQGDTVYGGTRDEDFDHLDNDTDRIATGRGDDAVISGRDGLVNGDTIDLGAGDDYANVSGRAAHGLAGGRGDDTLRLQTSGEVGEDPWLLDARDEALIRLGVPHYSWTGLDGFDLEHVGAGLPLSVKGSPRDERFLADGRSSGAGPVSIAAGGGDDLVAVNQAQRGDVSGGPGRDRLLVDSGSCLKGRLTVRLAGGKVKTACGGTRSYRAKKFEDATVSGFGRAAVVGTSSSNHVQIQQTCAVRVIGGAGKDLLRIGGYFATTCGRFGVPRASTFFAGGKGNDVLVGHRYDDELFGGPGRDIARGRVGVDICRAEVRQGCERR